MLYEFIESYRQAIIANTRTPDNKDNVDKKQHEVVIDSNSQVRFYYYFRQQWLGEKLFIEIIG